MATKNSLATRSNGSGKNIASILDPNNASDYAKTRALWRTHLVRELNTSRCTTSQELKERFDQLFKLCFENNFIPTVESLALCSGIDRRSLWDIETRKHA